MAKGNTNTKRYTLVTRYGEKRIQYVTTSKLAARGQVAVLTIWDEGAGSEPRVIGTQHVTATKARAHARKELDSGLFWEHEVETARALVRALRRAAGTEDTSWDTMRALGCL